MLISGYGVSQSQTFPQMGQLPSTAFPLCGLDTFRQLIIPYDSGRYIVLPGCGNVRAPNPYYYSFTCYGSGKLALLIEPASPDEDYNWELFDITAHQPDDIYTNSSLAVIGNWSGTYGRTGARNNGVNGTLCLSSPTTMDSTFSAMPALIQGHHYLLLVSGYSRYQSDYFVSFAGSTAIITDPESPHLKSAFVGCNKKIITVVVNKQIRCYSLAADGSDFMINTASVSITGASGLNCNDQFDFDSLELTLSDTLAPGNYTVSVKRGSDDKILWDNCFREVPPGDNIPFTVFPAEVVSADFSYQIGYGCHEDTAFLKYALKNATDQSLWYVDSVFAGSLPQSAIIRSEFRPMQVQHIVSNGFCRDTVTEIINFDNYLKAAFQSPATVCPKDFVTFSNQSIGNIVSWNWNFGDGTSSFQENPPAHMFPVSQQENKYLVRLIIENNLGCYDTFATSLMKLQSCYIAVPNAFTPNGDGKNDYLFPLNTTAAADLEFMVYNRFGQLLFETKDRTGRWDGSVNGTAQPTGTYIWIFRYTDVSGKKIFLRGTSVLIR